MSARMIKLFGVACGRGGPDHGPAAGPAVLQKMGLLAALRRAGLEAGWAAQLETPLGDRWQSLGALDRELALEVAGAIASGALPLIIGGDHSIAAGTWRGVALAYQEGGRSLPGLVWIDAHLDAHTPATSLTGNPHGMPLAALLGHGAAEMVQIPGPPLDPTRVAVVGAHSYEPEELALLHQAGVRLFSMDEVRRRGLGEVLEDAVQVAMGPAGGDFGVSLDLDAIDPREAPGVSTPVDQGVAAEVLRRSLRGLLRHERLAALELVEFNPARDQDNRSARLVIDLVESAGLPDGETLKQWEGRYGARNYAPLPVVLAQGEGSWLWDVDGRRYLDLMSAYSAVSFGHSQPRLLAALRSQAGRLAVTSRAFHSERLPLFLKRLTDITGYDRALPVNTGLEAVETALKAARKWGHRIKGIADGQAEIIACAGNFHGRSITIVGLSTEAQYRDGFGPFPPGLKTIPYGDAAALEAAITPQTAAFLVEPVQGEGGIIVPPRGYLAACAEICRRHNVLLIADEVQTGLGRTGRLLASEHEGVRPDGVILGKALGGGLLPVSAFLADDSLMQVFTPGDHGSTFGGNALAASVALEALDLLLDEGLVERSAEMGAHLLERLHAMDSPAIRAVRGIGLFAGIDLEPRLTDAREFCELLLERGVLSKDTHHTVVRLAPPLNISRGALDWGLDQVEAVARLLGQRLPRAA